MMRDLYGQGLVTAEEVRAFLSDYLGLPLGGGVAAPQEKAQSEAVEHADIAGMTANGNVKKG